MKEFWISNISSKNVCVADLALTIPARKHVDLLNKKHYHYTLEQLEQSATVGSLFKKNNILKIRKVAPDEPKVKPGIYLSNVPLFFAKQNLRSSVVVEEPQYEELIISDEYFAEDITKE